MNPSDWSSPLWGNWNRSCTDDSSSSFLKPAQHTADSPVQFDTTFFILVKVLRVPTAQYGSYSLKCRWICTLRWKKCFNFCIFGPVEHLPLWPVMLNQNEMSLPHNLHLQLKDFRSVQFFYAIPQVATEKIKHAAIYGYWEPPSPPASRKQYPRL